MASSAAALSRYTTVSSFKSSARLIRLASRSIRSSMASSRDIISVLAGYCAVSTNWWLLVRRTSRDAALPAAYRDVTIFVTVPFVRYTYPSGYPHTATLPRAVVSSAAWSGFPQQDATTWAVLMPIAGAGSLVHISCRCLARVIPS
jgi:hypothetical protein